MQGNTWPGDGSYEHTTIMREIGHELCTSGFELNDIVEEIIESSALYQSTHPSVSGSIMNYDSKVTGALGEPDCYPHAFDVMAVWALYQTVK